MTLKDLWNKLDLIAVLGFLIAIDTQISNGSMSLAHTLPETWIPLVKEQAANLATIFGALVGIIRMSSNGAQPPSITSTIVKILIVAFIVSQLFPNAYAQTLRQAQQPFDIGAKIKKDVDGALTGSNQLGASSAAHSERQRLGCDLLNLKPGCKTAKASDDIKSLDDALSPAMKDFIAFTQGDVGNAIGLTSKIPGLPDGNGQACYRQLQSSGDIIKALRDAFDGGNAGIATVYEALRLLHMNMIKTCNNKACTQIFNEATNVIAAAAPMKTQIPNVAQMCAQVPSIAMEPVTADTAAAAAETPAPNPAATPAPTPIQSSGQ